MCRGVFTHITVTNSMGLKWLKLRTSVKRALPTALVPFAVKALGIFRPQFVEKVLFNRRLENAVPVLIYQMGKVGSTSIFRSLQSQYPGVVVHAHSFSPDHFDWKVRALHNWAIEEKKPLNAISLTREPISRNISSFFQNFEHCTGMPFGATRLTEEDLKELFLLKHMHDTPLRWFDEKIRVTLGIDVYAAPFPECGVATYSRGNIKLLVMRLELDERTKTEAVKDFLDLDRLEVYKANVATEKDYGETYQQFVHSVKLPNWYVHTMCESQYFRHFYTAEAIEQARKRWSEG
jgi:Putative capsular polysaccharide synthesis protein